MVGKHWSNPKLPNQKCLNFSVTLPLEIFLIWLTVFRKKHRNINKAVVNGLFEAKTSTKNKIESEPKHSHAWKLNGIWKMYNWTVEHEKTKKNILFAV